MIQILERTSMGECEELAYVNVSKYLGSPQTVEAAKQAIQQAKQKTKIAYDKYVKEVKETYKDEDMQKALLSEYVESEYVIVDVLDGTLIEE